MPTYSPSLDNGTLLAWEDIADDHEWNGILLGNGASIAVWDGFRYGSLYELATSEAGEHPLGPEDVPLVVELDARALCDEEMIVVLTSRSVDGRSLVLF